MAPPRGRTIRYAGPLAPSRPPSGSFTTASKLRVLLPRASTAPRIDGRPMRVRATCGQQHPIPIRDRYGRLIAHQDPQIISRTPHPVPPTCRGGARAVILLIKTAKAADPLPPLPGEQPRFPPHLQGLRHPFTMEAHAGRRRATRQRFCLASLVLGIISLLPSACVVSPSVLAIIFGVIIGYNQVTRPLANSGGGKEMAIAGGSICGWHRGVHRRDV